MKAALYFPPGTLQLPWAGGGGRAEGLPALSNPHHHHTPLGSDWARADPAGLGPDRKAALLGSKPEQPRSGSVFPGHSQDVVSADSSAWPVTDRLEEVLKEGELRPTPILTTIRRWMLMGNLHPLRFLHLNWILWPGVCRDSQGAYTCIKRALSSCSPANHHVADST